MRLNLTVRPPGLDWHRDTGTRARLTQGPGGTWGGQAASILSDISYFTFTSQTTIATLISSLHINQLNITSIISNTNNQQQLSTFSDSVVDAVLFPIFE